jgi:hypothetical protein
LSKSSILVLASLLAIAGAGPTAADQWWPAKGQQCWNACTGTPRAIEDGGNLYVCKARPQGGPEWVAGSNLKQSHKCLVAYPVNDKRLGSALISDYECLCR